MRCLIWPSSLPSSLMTGRITWRRGRPKLKERKPWDRLPWSKQGDVDQDLLYTSVGRALSEWERYDTGLAFLFAAFVSPTDPSIGRRAYSAVRTFEGRLEMLRAASEAHFTLHPNAEFLAQFKAILRDASVYSQRRNDIAHGTVDHYQLEPPAPLQLPAPDAYGLFPSFASFRERDIYDVPNYCYTSPELEYFRRWFLILRRPVGDLSLGILRADRRRALLSRPPRQYYTATNPEPDQNAPLESPPPPEPSQE
jgi:hypothetical protein